MIAPRVIIALGAALAAVGLWWLLPGSNARRRMLGGVLAVVGFGLLGSQLPFVGEWLGRCLFGIIAAATVVAAVATISCRSPVYCAIWFGMTLAGTAGLFLLAGAEFLAVATVVVYAGAILVTLLFVIMLSQPEGHTSYDRRSWEPMISAFTGAVLLGILTATIGAAITETKAAQLLSPVAGAGQGVKAVSHASALPGDEGGRVGSLTISRLGAELFTRYLAPVEAAGVLLFAALVGAAAIVAQGRAAMKRPKRLSPLPPKSGGTAHVS